MEELKGRRISLEQIDYYFILKSLTEIKKQMFLLNEVEIWKLEHFQDEFLGLQSEFNCIVDYVNKQHEKVEE